MAEIPEIPMWCFQPDDDTPGLYLALQSAEQREAVMRSLGWTPEKESEDRAARMREVESLIADALPQPSQDEDEIINGSDYPGEAAERIARYRGCSFGEALVLVQAWMTDQDRRATNPSNARPQ